MANFQKIKSIVKEKGMTIKELADEVGITDAAISILIRENSTNTKTIEAIARVLEVPVGTFFDEPVQVQPEMPSDSGNIVLTPEIQKMLNEKDETIKMLTKKLCCITD